MYNRVLPNLRKFRSMSSNQLRVAVIGSGPAGFYTAKFLSKACPGIKVDIFEKLDIPFGLIRFGVAPDHPEVRNVTNDFSALMEGNPNIRFFGRVNIGQDLSLDCLCRYYQLIVGAAGASRDKSLNIPGEFSPNVYASMEFVNWYNFHPEFGHVLPRVCNSLKNKKTVGIDIIGNGNVALDIARMFIKSTRIFRESKSDSIQLKATNVNPEFLQVMSSINSVKIRIIGRRGPGDCSFTVKELRELVSLSSCYHADPFDAAQLPNSRLMTLIKSIPVLNSSSINDNDDRNIVVFHNHLTCRQVSFTPETNTSTSIYHSISSSSGTTRLSLSSDVTIKCIGNSIIDIIGFEEYASKKPDSFHKVGWYSVGSKGVLNSTLIQVKSEVVEMMRKLDQRRNNNNIDDDAYSTVTDKSIIDIMKEAEIRYGW